MSEVKQKVWVVFQHEPGEMPWIVGSRLTFDAAVSLCKLAGNRYWKKTVATKEVGAGKFDTAEQQEKQHGTTFGEPA